MSKQRKNTLVISAYPACGKSTYFYKYSRYANKHNEELVLDSDSSKFSWVYDEFGNKTDERDLNFPKNYINHIREHMGNVDIIFVSTHKEVREALAKAHIPYISVYPKDTLLNMEDWKNRFLSRGNTQFFVEFQMTHWTEFINDLKEDTTPILKVELDVQSDKFAITKNLIKYIEQELNRINE